jgi:hypothetical protein
VHDKVRPIVSDDLDAHPANQPHLTDEPGSHADLSWRGLLEGLHGPVPFTLMTGVSDVVEGVGDWGVKAAPSPFSLARTC